MRVATVETLRKRIAALHEEKRSLGFRSRAEVGAILDTLVTQWCQAGSESLLRDVHTLAIGEPANPLRGPALVGALLGVDNVLAGLQTALLTVPEGQPKAQRVARIAEIDKQLDRLETEEEQLVVANGIERRLDVRPEIVLG